MVGHRYAQSLDITVVSQFFYDSVEQGVVSCSLGNVTNANTKVCIPSLLPFLCLSLYFFSLFVVWFLRFPSSRKVGNYFGVIPNTCSVEM